MSFNNTPPEEIGVVGISFADHIADAGLTFDIEISPSGDVACTFTTPYRGLLKPKAGRSELLSLDSVDGVTLSLPPDEWEDGYEVDASVEVTLLVLGGVAEGFSDEPVSDQASFEPLTDPISIAGIVPDGTPPGTITISGVTFDNTPPSAVSTASASTIYYGSSASTSLEGEALKSALQVVDRGSVAGTYLCNAGGYKFLAVPATMTAPATIRDLATGFGVPLADSDDGFTQSASGLTYKSVSIDGVGFRLYRSKYPVVPELTLQVA